MSRGDERMIEIERLVDALVGRAIEVGEAMAEESMHAFDGAVFDMDERRTALLNAIRERECYTRDDLWRAFRANTPYGTSPSQFEKWLGATTPMSLNPSQQR